MYEGKKLKIVYKNGEKKEIEHVDEFSFGKKYLFIKILDSDIKSITTSEIESIKMNERNIKIPKRCKGE